jgi:hypothetical protein
MELLLLPISNAYRRLGGTAAPDTGINTIKVG